ncbi:hypothetical protein FB382_002708 [Nocardioides ginsengisegetis]|uniref:Uncharacterized protein n=1 Tax=Nocardioides ginsengisegetis TaxID=661491 RepID=A0A7W3PAG2_9ACTN|nr:hypothetical protein [Nocardioides ginsengisegetis]MBA8804417.1 hypothetical protein [Nocardioides ginsengisegetis]
MHQLPLTLLRLHAALVQPRHRADRDDRGDVPGWVLITVMTAGLVMVIWGVARDQLSQMLRDALNSVHN